jgi:hypothetical protein
MKLNVSSIRQRLQKLEQYISELEKQQPITLETLMLEYFQLYTSLCQYQDTKRNTM